MKNFICALTIVLLANLSRGQVLNVPQIEQAQDQWCWVGVSKCILDYYGYPKSQCEIAEYTRTVATWHSFGSQNCCTNPYSGCNYWNYNWGSSGSIQDILMHFGSIQNVGRSSALGISEIGVEISNRRPFVIRWGWTNGGGHFIVGHGIADDKLYYMDPWPGEGLKLALYSWVVSNSDHSWTHTNQITSAASGVEDIMDKSIDVYPNPNYGQFVVQFNSLNQKEISLSVVNTSGQNLLNEIIQCQADVFKYEVDLSDYQPGVYLLNINFDNTRITKRIVVLDK